MRKFVTAVAVGSCLTAMLAVAAGPEQNQPEARAYVQFDFGGNRKVSNDFFYGLRLDHDRRYALPGMPSIAGVDFSAKRGFLSAQLNGLPFAYRTMVAGQDEGAGEFVEGAAEGDTVYTTMDWVLLGAGVLGVGYAAVEVFDSEDGPVTGQAPPPDEEEGGGGLLDIPVIDGVVGGALDAVLDIVLGIRGQRGLGFLPTYHERQNIEHQRWLDGGTGQMGDLGG